MHRTHREQPLLLVPMSDVASRRSEYESAGLDVVDVDRDPLRQWQRWYDDKAATKQAQFAALDWWRVRGDN